MEMNENLARILQSIPPHVKVVAVSKTHPPETIREFYNQGLRVFGENKAQELINKQPQLPDDIEWHFIGHLQRNKVKYIVPFVSLIHSVDSLRLLAEINKEAGKNGRVIDFLFQFHIATEQTKFGLDLYEARDILNTEQYIAFNNIRPCGVMGMGTFTDDEAIVRDEFKQLKRIFDALKSEFFQTSDHFKEISMGMSGDYPIAIEEGSTIVRIGNAIFGERFYPA
jgi:pyridoxal phosphate enzyme (YggS family)